MAEYKMTAKELIMTNGSSRGSQIKFRKDDYWYKIDETGPEGKAEELAYKILSCSNLTENELTKYESCTISYEGKKYNGCRSKDFLKPGEQLLSYSKIYKLMTGKDLSEEILRFETPKERIDFVSDIIYSFCKLDVKEHIAKNLTVSMFIMDTDRHFNNIGIIADAELSSFRNAPIFDHGAAFLSNYTKYPPNITIQDLKNDNIIITGKPFTANLEYQAHEAGYLVNFDFDKINKMLDKEPNSRMKDIAYYLANKYEKVLQQPKDIKQEINTMLSKYYPGKDITTEASYIAQNYGQKFIDSNISKKTEILKECVVACKKEKENKKNSKHIDTNDCFDEK